jgi:Protein of unknown function (DUF3168)
MVIPSSLALQRAMLSRLAADSSLAALVGGSAIYDDVPQGTRPPYVSFGDIATRDWSTKEARGEEHFATLFVWSRERGRKQAYAIIGAIDAALDGAALVLEGHRLVNLSTTFWTVARDGENYRGIVRLRAATERI